MDGLSAWFVLAAKYCDYITNPSTKIFNIFQFFFVPLMPTSGGRTVSIAEGAGNLGHPSD